MTARTTAAALVVMAGLLLAPRPASGQQGGAPAPPQQDTTELVFQREVFSYPSFDRRNPFTPLVGAGDGGPRFEELSLLGIIHSPNPELSVALLSAGGAASQQSGGPLTRTFRVRQGQSLGNSRILDIQQSRVIVEVTEFGITEQRVLELQRPAEGGSS